MTIDSRDEQCTLWINWKYDLNQVFWSLHRLTDEAPRGRNCLFVATDTVELFESFREAFRHAFFGFT